MQLSDPVLRDGTVAIRVSSHPVAQALSMGLGKPVVSTSANLAGQPACYRIEDVRAQLGDAPDVYLDGGSLQPQPPSTIVGLDDYGHPEVLREGAISLDL